MGLLDKIFPKAAQEKAVDGYFKTLNAYTPVFTSYAGGLYEMELTRAAVDRYATQCAKLKPEIQGKAYKNLEKMLQFQPNPFMNTYQFIYRIATILAVDTTAFIVPLYGEDQKTIIGFYPLLPARTELVQFKNEPWLRYTFNNGQKAAIELSKVGVMTQYQYKDDFFGDGNAALLPTLSVLSTQKQGIEEGIRQSAMIRFMAKLTKSMRSEDIIAERNRFAADNLSSDNTTGLLMFDAKYSDMQQIDSKPFIVDADQMRIIQNNVYNYFGVSEAVLQNSYTEDQWNAFYEGKIEPFAIQLSLVLSNMLYTSKELAYGNQIIFTANRLQYASNATKLQVSSQMFDRGILTQNQVMDIWNMAHVEDGDNRYIRREYVEVSKLDEGGEPNANDTEPETIQTTDTDPAEPGDTEEN